MAGVKISVEIDGTVHDIKDCFWTLVEPCGCTGAAMTTRHYVDGVGHVGYLTNEEMAWTEYFTNRGVREQEKARGAKFKLIAGDDYTAVMTRQCLHKPAWGRVEVPDGKTWGLSAGHRVVHVVDELESGEGRHVWRTALCAGELNFFEVGSSVLSEKPMCKKCLKAVSK
ncbi:hypothetical protein ACT17S_11425 [Glutamicibacter mysorens]